MPIKNTRLAQAKAPKNSGTPTVSAWDYPFDMTPEEQAELDALAAEESAIYSNGAAMMAVVMAEWKAARERHPAFEVAVMETTGGALTKGYDPAEDGTIAFKPGGKMNNGSARRTQVNAWDELAGLINTMKSNEALTLGRLRRELPKWVGVTTKNRLPAARLAAAQPGGFNQGTTYIARTAEFLHYEPGEPAPLLLDHDAKGMPEAVKARIEALGGFWAALCSVMPGLVGAARIERCSTSTGITRTDTGFMLPGGGLHVYLLIADGADAHRFLYDLHKRMWLAGFGYYGLGKSGQSLDRSIVDCMVHAPERLVFEGAPVLAEGLYQDKTARMAVAHDGAVLDTREACPSLSGAERTKLNQTQTKAKDVLAPERAVVRERYVAERAQELAERTAMPLEAARRVIEKQTEGVLYPDFILPFDDAELDGTTVADVLADPRRFEGETLADPIEGIDYGCNKARVELRTDGTPWIHSFAHGRTIYELRHDAASARAALDAVDRTAVADTYVAVSLASDLGRVEEEALLTHAAKLCGASKDALRAELTEARDRRAADRAHEARARQAAERGDTRPEVPAPPGDAPWLPVMDKLNEVLGASEALEPPMRDVDGVVTQVRVRRAPDLHALTSQGSNEGDNEGARLPAPEQPLLTRLDEMQVAELIEQHIDFYVKVKKDQRRSVHLNGNFVRHYRQRTDDALPMVASIATLPVVTLDGRLMAAPGLDHETGIVFRIPDEVLALMPTEDELTDTHVAQAWDLLTNEWLCDVLTSHTGKAVIIAAVLTIIERALLPERPGFFVTSGRRGGGKTTALLMLIMLATGVQASAAAWSPNEEERRKALYAYLLEGLPALIWDNIKRGTQISCPHVERSLTAAHYSDRVLGVSQTIRVSAGMVQFFTGNNVGPKGDLTSRILAARLEIDRADPENRAFKHSDPIGWTEANRGKLLNAVYTILLANPHRRAAPKTRFKAWWSLVGSAVEHATTVHAAAAATTVHAIAAETARLAAWEDPPTDLPVAVDFRALFLAQEAEDEEGSALVDVLLALKAKFKGKDFTASDVAGFLNNTSGQSDADREGAQAVQAFFFSNLTAGQTVSSLIVGMRLKTRVGEPVQTDDKTLILRGSKDAHTKVWSFSVEVKD